MNATNRTAIKYIVILYVAIVILSVTTKEKYVADGSGRNDYRYGFVDTNPMRRISDPFDNCSPENFDECRTIA